MRTTLDFAGFTGDGRSSNEGEGANLPGVLVVAGVVPSMAQATRTFDDLSAAGHQGELGYAPNSGSEYNGLPVGASRARRGAACGTSPACHDSQVRQAKQ